MTQLVPVKQSSRRVTKRRVVGQRDHQAMEQRRMRAADLFERGMIPAEIARFVGVAHQVVSEWRKAWRQGGREALRSAGPAGRKPKLSDGQLGEVVNALARGAGANGYLTDVWTLPRVAQVIEQVAPIVGRSAAATRQLASRARRRVRSQGTVRDSDGLRQSKLVDAFLKASRPGE